MSSAERRRARLSRKPGGRWQASLYLGLDRDPAQVMHEVIERGRVS